MQIHMFIQGPYVVVSELMGCFGRPAEVEWAFQNTWFCWKYNSNKTQCTLSRMWYATGFVLPRNGKQVYIFSCTKRWSAKVLC